MICINGAHGGIGRFVLERLRLQGIPVQPLHARLENPQALRSELNALPRDASREATLIHLAAIVSVQACEENPTLAHALNVTGAVDTARTFSRWAHANGARPRVLYVSTGHVYAPSGRGGKTREQDPTGPRSVYAKTKRDAERALETLAHDPETPFELLVARVFGLLSPGQPTHYVLPSMIERVRKQKLDGVQGLTYTRDYLDARDVARHLVTLSQAPWRRAPENIVNICSGEATTIRDLLLGILKALHREELQNRISESPGRATDMTWIVGDPSRLVEMTGQPAREIPLHQTIEDAIREMGGAQPPV